MRSIKIHSGYGKMKKADQIFRKILSIHNENELSLKDTPFGTDKLLYKSYFKLLYPDLISSLPKPKVIVEIGVRGGASLYIWSLLFPYASVTGLDLVGIGESSGPNPLYISGNNITFIKGNAYTRETANIVQNKIDLLIDDGSHRLKDQLKTIELYLSKLSERGVLVIEDIQRGYRDAYKLLLQLPYDQYRLSTHDYRLHKCAYDDFAICITRGKTTASLRLYYKIRSCTFLLEHIFIKLLKRFYSTAGQFVLLK